MAERIFVKPKVEGGIVRDPLTLRQLKPEGEWKPFNTYWARRLKMGDVVDAQPAKAAKPAKVAKKGDE